MEERTPIDLSDVFNDIEIQDIGCALSDISTGAESGSEEKDLFAEHQQKGWDKSVEARCDFTRRLRITRRASIYFISIWQKSLMGRTLTDIKSDDAMINFFAEEMSELMKEVIGSSLMGGMWCIITTPKRRHMTRNFATSISQVIANKLSIPFYEDVCSCHTRQRINAEYTVNYLPEEPNIICFDDFVTTGSTLAAMKRAIEPHHKNIIFFAGINNKL